jgi:hypothetical protein
MASLVVLFATATNCSSKLSVTTTTKPASACAAGIDADAGFCETATNLSWQDNVATSPSLTQTATWTKSSSQRLAGQKIQFFKGQNCDESLASAYDLAQTSAESQSFTSTTYQTVSFKIISQDSKGRKNTSSCSKSITFQAPTVTTTVKDTTAPTISSIAAASTLTSSASAPIAFTISDNTTLACNSSYLSMTSSDPSLVPSDGVTWGGSYPSCTAVITPATGQTGNATIQFTVTDNARNSASASFSFVVSSTLVIGQSNVNQIANVRYGLAGPTSTLKIGSKFLVSEWNKINIYNAMPTTPNPKIDLVIGSPVVADYLSYDAIPTSATTLNQSVSIATDGTKLIVNDSGNYRILIWNSLPTALGVPADVVIGQANMTSVSPNAGGSVGSNTLSGAKGIHVSDTGKLYVADASNNRILIWNSIPTTNFANADIVIGQSNFTTNTTGTSSTTLSNPTHVQTDGSKMYVVDSNNHRILIWNSIPTSNGAAADVVVGQANMTSATSGATATTVKSPSSLLVTNGKLLVCDNTNYRILIWNTIPTSNNQAASLVLGQADFTSAPDPLGTGLTNQTFGQSGLGSNAQLNYIDGKLYFPDQPNNRVLVWNGLPSTINQGADAVIGQTGFESNFQYNHGQSFITLGPGATASTDGTRLFVSDSSHNRVLIWNSIPSTYSTLPNLVLGQPNLSSAILYYGGVTSSSLGNPYHATVIGSKFVVADSTTSRILIWNSMPTSNQQAADLVLGQANFSSYNVSTSATGLRFPYATYSDGTKFYVVDLFNYRIKVWNTFPTVTNQAADFAIGQANLTTKSMVTSNATLNSPTSMAIVGTKLIIADMGNSRILIWNTVPTTSGVAANVVLGQTNFTNSSANSGGSASASSLNAPYGVTSDGTRLFVSDSGNNRILVWNSIPTSNYQAADAVLGQPDFTSTSANAGTVSDSSFSSPGLISYASGKLFISDSANMRVLIKPYP